ILSFCVLSPDPGIRIVFELGAWIRGPGSPPGEAEGRRRGAADMSRWVNARGILFAKGVSFLSRSRGLIRRFTFFFCLLFARFFPVSRDPDARPLVFAATRPGRS